MNAAILLSMIAAVCVNHSGYQTNGDIEKCESAMITCTTKVSGKTTSVKSDTEVFACAKKLVKP